MRIELGKPLPIVITTLMFISVHGQNDSALSKIPYLEGGWTTNGSQHTYKGGCPAMQENNKIEPGDWWDRGVFQATYEFSDIVKLK